MKFRVIGVLVAWCALPAHYPLANPVSDSVVEDFRILVHETAVTGKCPDAARLVRYFGSYGVALLSTSDLDDLDRKFTIFAPLMVEAQRPCQRLNFGLQAFYRERATPAQSAAMKSALRDWLTAHLDAAPWSVVVGPASAAGREIQRSRIVAAEMLVAWEDAEAAPLMQRLAEPDTLTAELQWLLERAIACLHNPRALSFLHLDRSGSVQLLQTVEDLKRARMRRWNYRDGDAEYVLSSQEVTAFFRALSESHFRDPLARSWGVATIDLEFEDGVVASVSTSNPGCIAYKDNTSLDIQRQPMFENGALRAWILELYEREIGERSE